MVAMCGIFVFLITPSSPIERPDRLIVNGTSPGIASVGDVVENVQQFV
jgi:hypothetical protein